MIIVSRWTDFTDPVERANAKRIVDDRSRDTLTR